MNRLSLLLRRNWGVSALFLVLAVAYLVQVLTSPVDKSAQARYHITATHLHQLSLAIALPYIVIWVVGLVSYLWLRSYTTFLGKDKDAAGFRTLTRGVFLMTFWLPASTLAAGLASNYYWHHPDATAALIRTVNYLNIILLLPAFWWVYKGADQLLAAAKIPRIGLTPRQVSVFIAFAALYVFLTFHDSSRLVAAESSIKATYYLTDWWILFTIVIPRLLMWYLGFAAASSVILYRRRVKGAIYKEALQFVALGLTGIVCATIVLRIVQSLSAQLIKLSLPALFLIVYALLALIAVGYVLLAKGASRLQKIEES